MKKKIKKTVDVSATLQDFQQAYEVQTIFDSNFKKSDAFRLMEAVVTFDELSTANIYHLQLTHRYCCSSDAISTFTKSIQGLCEFWLIASIADYTCRFIVVSHLAPSDFQKYLERKFYRLKTESLFNIIF